MAEDEERYLAAPEESALLTKYNTADRLAEELEHDAGDSGAVREYPMFIRRRLNRFEDVKFRKAVFQDDVMQLQNNYKFTVGDGATEPGCSPKACC